MPELCTIHPLDPALVAAYVRAVSGEDGDVVATGDPVWSERLIATSRQGYERAQTGNEAGANTVSYGLARLLATSHPTFLLPSAGLSAWEARIDRGVGMLLRPPSRLFGEAGLVTPAARAMPIRLDSGAGVMGGAYIPARLVPHLHHLLETRTERMLRRLIEAELDGVAIVGLMMAAVAYASERNLGLYEAIDVIVPEAPEADPPGARVLAPNRKQIEPALRHRLEEAAKPPKKPGLVARVLRRGGNRPG